MKHIVLAIVAMAFAPLALAAQGQDGADPTGDAKQPTMLEIKQSIDSAVRRLGTVEATLASHTTTLNTLSSTITANHTTIVGKFAPQVAVVTARPQASGSSYTAVLRLLGDSSIPGFPAASTGLRITDNTLPAGTYLFELHQPYSDNALCNRSVPVRHVDGTSRVRAVCPMLELSPNQENVAQSRLGDGFGVYTYTTPTAFSAGFSVPTGFTFTDDKPAAAYSGAIKITKLK